MKNAYVVGTFDTKADELTYVATLIAETGTPVVTVDVSSQPLPAGSEVSADISNTEVARSHPTDGAFLGNTD
ncbi:MAG: Tm-1-like ATP-binding domain-containing protein, partial [Spirochaeta sp.]|nr:Tm-1-like ATP-binding domain-containing protein [Spirochaeta sp.]